VAAGESNFDNRKTIQLPTSSQKERDLVKDLTGVEVIILNSESAADLGEMISGVSPEHVGRTSERFQVDAGAVVKHISSTFPSTANFLGAHKSVGIFAYHPGFGMKAHIDHMQPSITGRLVARIAESSMTSSSVQIEIGNVVYEIMLKGSAVYSAPKKTFNGNKDAKREDWLIKFDVSNSNSKNN